MKRVALFVGVNKYSNGIQPLSCARNDAEELWSFFRHGAKYDWVEKLVDEQAASADAVRRKIREMVAGLTHGDLFLLYFSGHGVPYLRRQLLVLADAHHRDVQAGDRNDPPFGTVALDSLIDDTEGDFDRVFLLDMCRAPLQDGQKGVAAGFSRKDLNLLPAAPRRRKQHSLTILFSCDEKQHSVEIARTGRGVFSLALSSLVRQRMEAGRKVLLDAGFVGAMENEMAHVARDNGIDPEEQRPQLEPHGDPIILVDPYGTAAVPPVVVACPVCGKKNRQEDTFKCHGCGRDNLCLRHQDAKSFLCCACAENAAAAGGVQKAEAERKARTEAVRQAVGGGIRQEEERKAAGVDTATDFGQAMRRAGETTTITLPGGAEMEMVWCPPGEFMMGRPVGEALWGIGTEIQHHVTLTEGFWMAKYPVTQEQWQSVMGNNPAEHKGTNLPVENVSWDDCVEFCRKAGNGLRLPTEAQWEYACRAGSTGAYAGTGRLEEMGWYEGNSGNETHPVGQKRANAWGLYDMHGNVNEWCADRYASGYYAQSPVENPKGPAFGVSRVLRGGSYWCGPRYCRSAGRDWGLLGIHSGFCGFRPVARQD